MPSLFSLFVDLKANTAEFVSGMSTASYAAKKAGRDIEESFSTLGSVATAALAPFGEIGEAIGETLTRVGEYASRASEHFAELGGGMNAIAVSAGVAAGALAAIEGGAIALAVHTAESAARMNELSKQTGVSVTALSSWAFVAKQSGVDQETMAKSLEFLSANMLKAGTAAPGAINAFSRLGVSVKDSNGQLRDAGVVMQELLEKLATINPTAAVGFGRQLFGRGGDALLSIDPEDIQPLIDKAHELGIALDPELAESAEHFHQTLGVIEAAGQGLALRLTEKLLPALQQVANVFTAKSTDTSFIDRLATTIEGTLGVIDTLWSGIKQIWTTGVFALEELGTPIVAVWAAAADIITGHFSDAWKDIKDGAKSVVDYYREASAESAKIWSDNANFIKGLKPQPKSPFDIAEDFFKRQRRPVAGAELAQPQILGVPDKDQIADLVAKLAAQASAELALASSIQTSVAAMTLEKAAGEAEIKTAEERTQLLDREKTLRAQLAAAQAGAHPEEAAKFKSEIASVQAYLAELDRDAPLIRQRYEEIAAAKLFASTNEELGKESIKFDSEIASLDELVAAYKEGGSAIAAADVSKQIEAARQKVADLVETYARFAAENPFDLPALADLGAGLLNADAELQKLAASAAALKNAEIEVEIQKQTRAFEDQLPALTALADAYSRGADAVREAQVRLKVAQYQSANPGASADQIKSITALYQQESDVAYQGAIAQQAARYNLSQQYSDEIEKLNQIRELLQSQGVSTLAVDAAIYDANQKNIEQWDQAALKVGTFGERLQAVFNEVQLEGQSWGEKIFDAFNKSIDDASTQLAKFVVTGKSNFKQLFESLEESIAKAGFERLFASVTSAVTGQTQGGGQAPGGTPPFLRGPSGIGSSIGGILGLGGKGAGAPDGSSANPFYTVPVDSQGNILGDLTGKNVGTTSVIGSLFGKKNSEEENPLYTPALYGDEGGDEKSGLGGLTGTFSNIFHSIEGTIGGIGKSIFSAIGGIFGGFLANGGGASPGKAYIVGEKHPEFFIPRQSGQVVPSLKVQSGHTINMGDIHVYNPSDTDSFKRSAGQAAARQRRELELAFQRNG